MGNSQRLIVVLMSALALQACASGARPERMVPDTSSIPPFSAASPLHNAIALTSVTGGEETNPLGHSTVSDTDLKAALNAALAQAGLLNATATAPLHLAASLVDLSHPPGTAAFTMHINAAILYRLTRANTGEAMFDEVITTTFTATVQDEFIGIERLRIANEGAVRANIATFLQRLATVK